MKDLLLNVGSGGGAAAAAPASGGGAAAGGAAPAEDAKAEEKEEGTFFHGLAIHSRTNTDPPCREGRVRRGYGIRSFRLSASSKLHVTYLLSRGHSDRRDMWNDEFNQLTTKISKLLEIIRSGTSEGMLRLMRTFSSSQ